MKTLRRVSLFGFFAAIGVGLAVCVAMSAAPPPEEESPPSASGVSVGRPFQAGSDGLERPSCNVESPSHNRAEQAAFHGPRFAQPYPRYAQAEDFSDAERAKFREAFEFLQQRLAAESGAKPAAAAPATVPPAVAAPVAAVPPVAPAAAAPELVPSPKPEGKPPKAVIGAEGDGRLNIHIQNADIREVLDLLSEQGNLNILAGKDVQGKVSATLTGVDIDSALVAILRSTGYVARREGKFIFVGTPDEFNTLEQSLDRVGTRVYRPNYVAAVELQKLIQPLVSEKVGVVTVSTPAQAGIPTDGTAAGGNTFSGGDVVVVRDYEAVLTQIDQMVAEVDVRPMQVHIEAMILSVKLKDEDRFGVNFQLLRDKQNINFALGKPETSLANMTYEKGALKFGFLDSSLGAFLDALETIGDTNVVASPRLMVLNKQRAEIQIGEKKGYVSTTVTETSSTQSVEFLDIGALLRLRPYISSDGLIRMEVHPELSDGNVDTSSGFTLPNKEITQVTTNIMVRDGCTVVIGGLMRENLATNTAQIPLFGNLPLVGFLFRSKTETVERREVMVLITPHIVYEPGTCQEGVKAAGEFHRRHSTYADKMSPLGKRSIGRRYFRLAQSAYASGDRNTALRFAEMAVQFDPLNRAAIDLRSCIWLNKPYGEHSLEALTADGPAANPIDGQTIAPWLLDDLERAPVAAPAPMHPLDPGQPGRRQDLLRPRKLE
jgi:type IV pilus assembly protein PilQ